MKTKAEVMSDAAGSARGDCEPTQPAAGRAEAGPAPGKLGTRGGRQCGPSAPFSLAAQPTGSADLFQQRQTPAVTEIEGEAAARGLRPGKGAADAGPPDAARPVSRQARGCEGSSQPPLVANRSPVGK